MERHVIVGLRAAARAFVLAGMLTGLSACSDSNEDGGPASTPTPAATATLTLIPTVTTPAGTATRTAGVTETSVPTPAPTATAFPTLAFLTELGGATIDYWPRWSPDGATVLFSRSTTGVDDGRYALYLVPSAGGTATALPGIPATLGATRASWSWPTDQIAFAGSPSAGVFDIYVVNPDGSDLRALDEPDTGTVLNYPSWYPSGDFLAIVDYGDVPDAPAGVLKKIGVTTPSTTVLTTLAAIYAGEPAVSPDGTTIAFPGQLNQDQPYDQNDNQIWLLPPSGTPEQFDPAEGRTPDWSPDGRYLAFESTRGCTSGVYAIFIEPVAGGDARQVTDCTYDGNHAVWSPDQTRIAFSAVVPGSTTARGIAVFEVPALP